MLNFAPLQLDPTEDKVDLSVEHLLNLETSSTQIPNLFGSLSSDMAESPMIDYGVPHMPSNVSSKSAGVRRQMACKIMEHVGRTVLFTNPTALKHVQSAIKESSFGMKDLFDAIVQMYLWSSTSLKVNLKIFEDFVSQNHQSYYEKWAVHMCATCARVVSLFDQEIWEDTATDDLPIEDITTEVVVLREVSPRHIFVSQNGTRSFSHLAILLNSRCGKGEK